MSDEGSRCWFYRLEGHKTLEDYINLVSSLRATKLLLGGVGQLSNEPAVRAFRNPPKMPSNERVISFTTKVSPEPDSHPTFATWNASTPGVQFYEDTETLLAKLQAAHPKLSFHFLRSSSSFEYGVAAIPVQIDTRNKQEPITHVDRRNKDGVPA